MKKFIGVKLVDAKPMTRGEYNILRGWELPSDENEGDLGYLVKYSSDYITWCPTKEFNKQNLHIAGENNTITQVDVNAMTEKVHLQTIKPNSRGSLVTVVTVTLKNGFTLTETSSCVDPANYDESIGFDVCMEKINNKIWFLLGFLLQSGLYGFSGERY